MKQQVIIEKIRAKHPARLEADVRAEMNTVKREFCRETRIIEGEHTTFNTDGSSVMYDMGDEVVDIRQVDLAGTKINQVSGVFEIELQT